MSDADSLTADDLRSKLYHSLREKGLVDALKSQLRNRLVSELQTVGLNQNFPTQKSMYAEDGSLILRAANSLVADHLRHSGCDYTLSVFLPECGSSEDKIFSSRDLLRLLNISPESSLFKQLAKYNSEGLDKKGFLWQLLCEVAKQHGHTKQEKGMQTDKSHNVLVTTIEEEFERLDQHYSDPQVVKGTRFAVEERMLAYQRQLDERSRTEINMEIARFKDAEVTRIRMEEREKYRKETDRTRKELERTYQSKVDALVDREKNSIERLQTQQEFQEKETYAQRQSILEEIDIVRKREAELRRQMELNLREKNLWEDRMKSQEEMLKKREEIVRKKDIEYEQRLHDEMSKYKTELDAKYLTRNKDIEYREIRLKEDERRVHEDMSDIKLVKDELREKRIKVNQLDADCQRAQHDVLMLRNQNELLSNKLRDMVDYQTLKDENSSLRKDLDHTKTRLAECQRDLQIERQKREEVLREMGERLAKPTPEHILLQTELDKARGSLRHEQALYDHHNQQSQIKLNNQVDRNRDMMRKYEEQSMQMKDMNREIRDLRHQLTHTRAALDSEVYGKPRKPYVQRSQSPSLCDLNDPPGLDAFIEPDPISTAEPELLISRDFSEGPISPTKSEISRPEDYSYSSDLIEDTKKRLRRLEREAENLEQNYNNFHSRMTSVHTALPPTAGALSAGTTLISREVRSSYMTDNKVNGNTNHSARPAYNSPKATLSKSSSERPRSSTPNRQPHPMSYRPYTPPPQDEHELPRMADVSPVHSNHDIGRYTTVRSNRPISMEDLEARPGSPSVVVVEGSVVHDATHADRTSPQGQERSEQSEVRNVGSVWKRPALDNAWKEQDTNPRFAESSLPGPEDQGPLTSTQKAHQPKQPEYTEEQRRQREEEDRRRQEDEDREYEERRQQREEERQKREQEAWEREQEELKRLEKGQSSKVEIEEKKDDGPAIDPVMQKYMAMVAAQKEKEKTIAKKTLSTWNKGRTLSEDKTPSVSEEISADDKSDRSPAPVDDDFDW